MVIQNRCVICNHFHLIPRFDGDGLDTWPKISPAQYNKDEILEKLRLTY